MSKGKFGIIGAFTLGFGLGAASYKWWPVVQEKMGPAGKDLLKKGLGVWDQAKDLFWDKSEKFADVISEIKEEQEHTTKGNGNKGVPEPT